MREWIIFMNSESGASIRGAQLIRRIANNLERAADLSTDICEAVIYMVQGRVVKHHYEERQAKKD